MKKTQFTEQQIAFALRQAETGTRASEVCRKLGIASRCFTTGRRSRGLGRVGVVPLKAAGRGEPPAQASGCRSRLG